MENTIIDKNWKSLIKPSRLNIKNNDDLKDIFKEFMKEAKVNPSKIPFRVPSGISFVKIDPNTGLVSKISEGMFEPFIIGTEPYNQSRLKKLDNLGTINNNSISGTGSLLSN